MADQTPHSNSASADAITRTGLRARLMRVRWLLLATLLLIGALFALNRISLGEASAGFLALLLVAALMPHRSVRQRVDVRVPDISVEQRDTVIGAFADSLSDPCIVIDDRSIVRHLNMAAQNQFSSALIGSPISFSMRNPPLLAAIEQSKTTQAQVRIELQQTIPNEVWYQVTVAPLKTNQLDALPDAPRFVISLHDLTEQRRIDSMRSDFIANASHELRTPLTSVIGFIDTLLGPAANDVEARARFLGIMRTQAERMSALISDLLSLSRIEQRQRILPSDKVDLGKLLPDVVEGLQNQAKEAELAVSLKLLDRPIEVTGDRDELYEVFENLLDNAIKYGVGGRTVEVVLSQPDVRTYRVVITDHGPGIASEHVPRLTERFYRVDENSNRKKKGTGLGLAIVKHIVNRHRGQMLIRSIVGEGTSVEVSLPCRSVSVAA